MRYQKFVHIGIFFVGMHLYAENSGISQEHILTSISTNNPLNEEFSADEDPSELVVSFEDLIPQTKTCTEESPINHPPLGYVSDMNALESDESETSDLWEKIKSPKYPQFRTNAVSEDDSDEEMDSEESATLFEMLKSPKNPTFNTQSKEEEQGAAPGYVTDMDALESDESETSDLWEKIKSPKYPQFRTNAVSEDDSDEEMDSEESATLFEMLKSPKNPTFNTQSKEEEQGAAPGYVTDMDALESDESETSDLWEKIKSPKYPQFRTNAVSEDDSDEEMDSGESATLFEMLKSPKNPTFNTQSKEEEQGAAPGYVTDMDALESDKSTISEIWEKIKSPKYPQFKTEGVGEEDSDESTSLWEKIKSPKYPGFHTHSKEEEVDEGNPPGYVRNIDELKEESSENSLKKSIKDPKYPGFHIKKSHDDSLSTWCRNKINLQADIGYFRPQSKRFRSIYKGGFIYSFEGGYQLNEYVYTWTNVSFFPKRGHTLGIKSDTSILLIPVILGFKFKGHVKNSSDQVYLAVGAAANYVHIHDRYPFFEEKRINWGFGGAAKLGYLLEITPYFLIDFFAGYQWIAPISYSRSNNPLTFPEKADVSGLSLGGGFSFDF